MIKLQHLTLISIAGVIIKKWLITAQTASSLATLSVSFTNFHTSEQF